MTKIQNFHMQGCVAVLCEQNDKLITLSERCAGLPIPILRNLRQILAVCTNLMDEVSVHVVTDEYIAQLRSRLGDLAVNVAMIEIQIKSYRQSRYN